MRQSSVLLLFLGLSTGVQADSLSDENARLKQRLDTLQTRVETLERSCPAAAGSAPAVPASSASVAPAPSAPAVVVPAAAPAPVTATAAANLDGTPQPAALPEAKKPPRPYADAGCDRGLFTGPNAGRWQKLSNWNPVKNGLTAAEVESAIGVEHYDVELGSGRTQWQYGRCSSSYDGAVEFRDGRVVSVVPPDR